MKRFLSLFTVLTIFFSPFAHAEDPIMDDDIFYTDEDDELFNRGRFVGVENDDYLRARIRQRNTNWAIALGSTIVGITTLVLVGQNHKK